MATESRDLADVGAVDVLAFLCELVALGIVATSGWRLGVVVAVVSCATFAAIARREVRSP